MLLGQACTTDPGKLRSDKIIAAYFSAKNSSELPKSN